MGSSAGERGCGRNGKEGWQIRLGELIGWRRRGEVEGSWSCRGRGVGEGWARGESEVWNDRFVPLLTTARHAPPHHMRRRSPLSAPVTHP